MSQRRHPYPAPIPMPWETGRGPRPPIGKPNHPRRQSRASEGRRQAPQGRQYPQPPGQIHRTGPRSHLAPLNHHHQEVPR